MDLLQIITSLWNIILLFLFFLPDSTLENMEKNKTISDTKNNVQLGLESVVGTFGKMSSTASPTFSTLLAFTDAIATNTKLLSSLTKTTVTTTTTTTKSKELMSTELYERNYTTKHKTQHRHYRASSKVQKNMIITADNSHDKFKSNMTTTSATTTDRKHADEHEKQDQHTILFATDFKYKSYDVQSHVKPLGLHDTTNSVKNNTTMQALTNTSQSITDQKHILSTPILQIAFELPPLQNAYQNQHTYGKLEISTSKSTKEMHIDGAHIIATEGYNIQRSNYNGTNQTSNNLSISTIAINSSNKSSQTTRISTMTITSTTKQPSVLTTKENHMYNNSSALSYLPYKSAALKAKDATMKTSNNENLFTRKSSGSVSSQVFSSSSDNIKRNTLLSSPSITSKTETAVPDNNSMKNSSNNLVQDTDDEENELKSHQNFKSNNSLYEISQTTVIATPTTPTTKMNETSPSSNLNVSSTHSIISTATTTAKEMQSTTATSITAATIKPKTTLNATTSRRRKIATTTLKPPPTIDDYQTITSQAGTYAYLPCNVKQLVKKPISWLRVRDGHILTVDQTTFIADQRFQSIYTINPERWSLQIKYVQIKDAGIYECQVSTEPKASAIVYLHVVEPKTELIGAPTRHVKAGSQVKLLCIISQALEPPLFINWFYNQKQIYLNNHRGWRTEIERIEVPREATTTATSASTATTIPTTTAAAPITTFSPSSATSSSLLTLSSTGSSMLNEIKIPTMQLSTSATPQQTLNDSQLLEMVSESTHNNRSNLIQPGVASISSSGRTEQSQATLTSSETTMTSSTTTTLPAEMPETLTFYNITDDYNDDDEDDFQTNPSSSTFDAISIHRGYMMLSSLMTFTDVKQITTASLIIPSVQKQDSGNYTCSPSNSEPRTVTLHVLNGEYSASAITSASINLHTQCNIFVNKLIYFTVINILLGNSLFYKQHLINQYNGG